ncbi:N,N-dimethylformamidase beta subunit family domain-containing protein [Conexibacter woesei]|nr:N,N-dimethylformamidase beta subunit family domain-containing protein [Conexibacter woesei]
MTPSDEISGIGYASRWTARPGETVAFHVSTAAGRYDATLVRLLGGVDAAGAVPELALGDGVRCAGAEQAIAMGSFAEVGDDPRLDLGTSFTVQLWICATTPSAHGTQGVVGRGGGEEGAPGWGIALTPEGDLLGWVQGADGARVTVRSGLALRPDRWAFVALVLDGAAGELRLQQAARSPWLRDEAVVRVARTGAGTGVAPGAARGPLLIGGAAAPAAARETGAAPRFLDGKLDGVRIWRRALPPAALDRLAADVPPLELARDGLVAAWDFAQRCEGAEIVDTSGNDLHGRVVNRPARAVTGRNWSGDEVDFRLRPHEYGAIHFHADDLDDAGWETSFALTVPADATSGVYAARLAFHGGSVEHVPFVVRGPGRARVALVLPTFTYQAYGNQRFGEELRASLAPLRADGDARLSRYERYAVEHELGLSLYDAHADGSMCRYSSRRRPILEFQPRYTYWLTGEPRHFSADLRLLGWLAQRGTDCELLTDEDLDREGVDALRGHRVVLTGSHPEYVTGAMRRALAAYTAGGGRLMYMGGNGFYWVTSTSADRGVVEVRRGHAGTRAGDSPPGEQHHSTSGELGGLWRHRGGAPHDLVGVGFSAQGWGSGAAYRRLPDSRDPRAAYVFAGVAQDEPIGAGGPLGGAAADEIDRAEPALGTPETALVLASSSGGHTRHFQLAVEDVPAMRPGQGGDECADVRADLTLAPLPGGGAVFATGSIGWVVSFCADPDGGAARVTANVLDRFGTDGPVLDDAGAGADGDAA